MLVYQRGTVKSSWDQIGLNLTKNSGRHSEHFSSTHTGLEQTLQGAPKQIVRTSTEAVANAGLGVGQKLFEGLLSVKIPQPVHIPPVTLVFFQVKNELHVLESHGSVFFS